MTDEDKPLGSHKVITVEPGPAAVTIELPPSVKVLRVRGESVMQSIEEGGLNIRLEKTI